VVESKKYYLTNIKGTMWTCNLKIDKIMLNMDHVYKFRVKIFIKVFYNFSNKLMCGFTHDWPWLSI